VFVKHGGLNNLLSLLPVEDLSCRELFLFVLIFFVVTISIIFSRALQWKVFLELMTRIEVFFIHKDNLVRWVWKLSNFYLYSLSKYLQPFSCGCLDFRRHRRILRMIFFRRHPYPRIRLFCLLFVGVGCLWGCFLPSFLKRWIILH